MARRAIRNLPCSRCGDPVDIYEHYHENGLPGVELDIVCTACNVPPPHNSVSTSTDPWPVCEMCPAWRERRCACLEGNCFMCADFLEQLMWHEAEKSCLQCVENRTYLINQEVERLQRETRQMADAFNGGPPVPPRNYETVCPQCSGHRGPCVCQLR